MARRSLVSSIPPSEGWSVLGMSAQTTKTTASHYATTHIDITGAGMLTALVREQGLGTQANWAVQVDGSATYLDIQTLATFMRPVMIPFKISLKVTADVAISGMSYALALLE